MTAVFGCARGCGCPGVMLLSALPGLSQPMRRRGLWEKGTSSAAGDPGEASFSSFPHPGHSSEVTEAFVLQINQDKMPLGKRWKEVMRLQCTRRPALLWLEAYFQITMLPASQMCDFFFNMLSAGQPFCQAREGG